MLALAFAEHGFGESNVFSDALTRGYIGTLKACCRQLSVTLETLTVPRAFLELLDELRSRNAALCAARGSTGDSRSTAQGPGAFTGVASNPFPTAGAPERHGAAPAAPAQRARPVSAIGASVAHDAVPPPTPTRPASPGTATALSRQRTARRPPSDSAALRRRKPAYDAAARFARPPCARV